MLLAPRDWLRPKRVDDHVADEAAAAREGLVEAVAGRGLPAACLVEALAG